MGGYRHYSKEIDKKEEKSNLSTETVFIHSNELKEGYRRIYDSLQNLALKVYTTAFASPVFSGLWLLLTEQNLLESPVAMAGILAGGLYIGNTLFQMNRLKEYTHLSLLCDKKGPARNKSINEQALKIIHGPSFTLRIKTFSGCGIEVFGPQTSSMPEVIPTEATIKRIQSIIKITVPETVLNVSAAEKINTVFDRWLTRITVPMSILNILAIFAKASDKKATTFKGGRLCCPGCEHQKHYRFFYQFQRPRRTAKIQGFFRTGAQPDRIRGIINSFRISAIRNDFYPFFGFRINPGSESNFSGRQSEVLGGRP